MPGRNTAALRWSGGGGPVLATASTGGPGDKAPLVAAPVLAACGARVPLVCGAGALERMATIPGYAAVPEDGALQRAVAEAGCAIAGRADAPALVPVAADPGAVVGAARAAGLDGLVVDVKSGSGGVADPRGLAGRTSEAAREAGLACAVLLTDLDRPLGRTVGGVVELREAIDVLTGAGPVPRLVDVVLELCAELLVLGGLDPSLDDARDRAQGALASGDAAERFLRMVVSLGGPGDLLDDPGRHLPRASVVRRVEADGVGTVERVDAAALARLAAGLGGEAQDPATGLADVAAPGEEVGAGAPLAVVHARSEADADWAAAALHEAYVLTDGPLPDAPPLIERP